MLLPHDEPQFCPACAAAGPGGGPGPRPRAAPRRCCRTRCRTPRRGLAGQGDVELHSYITFSSIISDGPDIKLSSRVTSRLSLTRPRLMLMRTSNLRTEDR